MLSWFNRAINYNLCILNIYLSSSNKHPWILAAIKVTAAPKINSSDTHNHCSSTNQITHSQVTLTFKIVNQYFNPKIHPCFSKMKLPLAPLKILKVPRQIRKFFLRITSKALMIRERFKSFKSSGALSIHSLKGLSQLPIMTKSGITLLTRQEVSDLEWWLHRLMWSQMEYPPSIHALLQSKLNLKRWRNLKNITCKNTKLNPLIWESIIILEGRETAEARVAKLFHPRHQFLRAIIQVFTEKRSIQPLKWASWRSH